MKCVSTRGGDSATLTEAVGLGLARDGGLFVPESIPHLTLAPRAQLHQTALDVLQPWFVGEAIHDALPTICRDAFSFDAPVRGLTEHAGLLEQFHGPTAAFKDFGARFLARCLPAPATVLVATSGDTGAAVGAAFHRLPGFRVFILYPDGRVSNRQAHQLGAFGDNVHAFKVQGSFDDCQRMVKEAFALRPGAFTSANSISLGRLLPQMATYAHAALHGQGLTSFVVPTGNLGNALACLLARAMGAPIGEVVLASNANDVLPRYFRSGRYEPRAGVATLANAMDVGAPSNLERLTALFPELTLRAESVSDDEIRACIARTWQQHHVALCPHTACGVEVHRRLKLEGQWLIAATAHPAKFESVVEPLIGEPVEVPEALAALLARSSTSEKLEANTATLLRLIDARA